MATRPANVTPFGTWLRAELDSRAWGVRTLARQMRGFEPEVARRALNRYLREGSMPTQAYRDAIAGALGIREDEMPASDDEEEEDPLAAASTDELLRALFGRVGMGQPREATA